jgi:hypothetical protein
MKKSLMIAFMLLSTTTFMNAQNWKDAPRFHFGIRGAVTESVWTGNVDALPFVSGGLAADFRIAPFPLYLESGLYYVNKGYKTQDEYGYTDNNHAVLMPFLVSYHIYATPKLAIQPFVGDFISYSPNSDAYYDDNYFDYGVRFGCGINYGRIYSNVGFDICLQNHDIETYSGSTSRYNYDETSESNVTFFWTIGFNIFGGR